MTPTNYDEVVDVLLDAAEARAAGGGGLRGRPRAFDRPSRDPAFRETINALDLVAPDGQPVRWAMNYFHKAGLKDRVYGPELTRRLCGAAAERGVSIYLYGSTPEVIEKLSANLVAMFPKLKIAGSESPPFRPLTPEEDAAVVRRINDSGAGLLFIGLAAPKQEVFAYQHRDTIVAVQVCVGAAFDFHASVKSTGPAWMQKRGMEWVYRLCKEPGRLWKRYLVTNSVYLMLFAKYAVVSMFRRRRANAVATHASPSASV